MSTFVLVHGAWGGSYGFRLLRPLLHAEGHNVFTPSLTGIGERVHLASKMDITLSTHIKDVANTIFHEDLDDIILLGFSYGGVVVTGLLDDLGSKVRHVVYLDALIPSNGQTAQDVLGGQGDALASIVQDGFVPPIPRQLETPEATAWSDARRAPQPLGTLTEPVQLSQPLEAFDFSRTFIKASADPGEAEDSAFWQAAHMAQESPQWNYHEISTNHMVPMTRPDELAKILLDIAANPRSHIV